MRGHGRGQGEGGVTRPGGRRACGPEHPETGRSLQMKVARGFTPTQISCTTIRNPENTTATAKERKLTPPSWGISLRRASLGCPCGRGRLLSALLECEKYQELPLQPHTNPMMNVTPPTSWGVPALIRKKEWSRVRCCGDTGHRRLNRTVATQ